MSHINFGFNLVDLNDENVSIEDYYASNMYKYKSENNFLSEGVLCLMTEDNKFNVNTNCFLTNDGIIIVEDWELAKEFLNDDNVNTEIVFFFPDKQVGYKVLLDDNIQWMRADAPGVKLPDGFKNLDEEDLTNYNNFNQEIQSKFKL